MKNTILATVIVLTVCSTLFALNYLWRETSLDAPDTDAFDSDSTPFITSESQVDMRCRMFIGIPKSGTTWVMNLMYMYLLLATGVRNPEPDSLSFANDHVKRAEYSCQYEWGEKQRNFTSPREELAYRLLPAFSHILRNADSKGDARKPHREELYHFERFFGVRRDVKLKLPHRNISHIHKHNETDEHPHWFSHTNEIDIARHYDTECLMYLHLREPLAHAVSACYYYPNVCGGKSGKVKEEKLQAIPSDDHSSIMSPLNATLRWSQAMATILDKSHTIYVTDRDWRHHRSQKHMSKCPPLRPHHEKHNMTEKEKRKEREHVAERYHRLRFADVRFGSYEQIVAAPEATLRDLLQFYQLPIDDRLVREAVRRVAKRNSLKQGVTRKHADVLFTDEQRAYAHRLSADHNPFYLPVVSALSPKPVGFETDASAVDSDEFDDSVTDHRAVFDKCWRANNDAAASARTVQLNTNHTCHHAWENMLLSAPLQSIDSVRALLDKNHEYGNRNGVIRVHMQPTRAVNQTSIPVQAQFKACDDVGSTETWKAELIAHAIDRVLAIRRVPAVVPRTLPANDSLVVQYDDPSLDTTHRHATKHLHDVVNHCQHRHTTMRGSLMGWFHQDLYTEKEFFSLFARLSQRQLGVAGATLPQMFTIDLTNRANRQALLELSKCLIGLYVCDLPHKLGHNIMTLTPSHQLLHNKTGPLPTTRLNLIAADNDRAHWLSAKSTHRKLSPQDTQPQGFSLPCNRTGHESRFACRVWAERDKLEMRHLHAILRSSCVFPRTVGERILRVTRDRSMEHLTRLYVARQLRRSFQLAHDDDEQRAAVGGALYDLWPFTMKRWHSRVLMTRVDAVADVLQQCIERFGEENVLLDE